MDLVNKLVHDLFTWNELADGQRVGKHGAGGGGKAEGLPGKNESAKLQV